MKKTRILKLIESNDIPKIGDIVRDFDNQLGVALQSDIPNSFNVQYNDGIYHRYYKPFGDKHKGLLIDKLIKPILISDEEINRDNTCLYADKYIKEVLIAEKEQLYFKDGSKAYRKDCKKVEVTSEQIPTNILEAIVEGKLVDGSEVEVEYDTEWIPFDISMGNTRSYAKHILKLDSNKTIVTIPEEDVDDRYNRMSKPIRESKMYSEEEVIDWFGMFAAEILAIDGDLREASPAKALMWIKDKMKEKK